MGVFKKIHPPPIPSVMSCRVEIQIFDILNSDRRADVTNPNPNSIRNFRVLFSLIFPFEKEIEKQYIPPIGTNTSTTYQISQPGERLVHYPEDGMPHQISALGTRIEQTSKRHGKMKKKVYNKLECTEKKNIAYRSPPVHIAQMVLYHFSPLTRSRYRSHRFVIYLQTDWISGGGQVDGAVGAQSLEIVQGYI